MRLYVQIMNDFEIQIMFIGKVIQKFRTYILRDKYMIKQTIIISVMSNSQAEKLNNLIE
jgi:CRISPR/Cas system-associated protein endoribonuclease Cas2